MDDDNPKPALCVLIRQCMKVARKLVLMEGDLERSEEKVELSERYLVFQINTFLVCFVLSVN